MRPGEPALGQIPGIPPLSAWGSDLPTKLHVRGQRPGAGHERLSAMQTWMLLHVASAGRAEATDEPRP